MPGKAAGGESAKRDRLAQRRRGLGLTQEALAELLGVERTTVVRWERGETEPSALIRPKLARALQVPADRLEELLANNGSGAEPGSGRDRTPTTPRQLPAAVADFTGRAAELQALTRILDQADVGVPGVVAIAAIGGTAGVGKTALALHWAHQVAHRFPDGELHVNLRGFDPSGTPATAAEAIRGFLDALGVPPARIPAQQDAQVGLYRSLLADKRMLIVLDNARDEHQVRPLLSASPASLVIITSRNQLTGLAAADGARLLTLDVLSHEEAIAMLTARVGSGRAAAEPSAVSEIASLCSCLPLALAVAAARAAASPGLPMAALAGELRDTASRLEALDAGDVAANVRAVFSWSYSQLSIGAARMFRLLGLHPGPDITVPAAAILAGSDEPCARRLLRELTHVHLITERPGGRFSFHDLLRTYAADQARADDSTAERAAAIGRVLDHYLHTATHAAGLLDPGREPIALAPPRPGAAPERPADYRQALAWFEAEHNVLLAATHLAEENGLDDHAWQLPCAMTPDLPTRGHHQKFAALQRTALAAATRAGDLPGQAVSNRLLADALRWCDEFDQALSHYKTSLDLYRRLGNRLGEAKVHQGLAGLAERQGRDIAMRAYDEQALALYREIGHKEGECEALNNLAWIHNLRGEYRQARTLCQQALTISAETSHRRMEGNLWDILGYAEQHLGNLGEAAACYQRAISIHREFGARRVEAEVLAHLGDTWHALGKLPRAREAWQQALDILQDLGSPDTDRVRAKLADMGD